MKSNDDDGGAGGGSSGDGDYDDDGYGNAWPRHRYLQFCGQTII